MSKMYANIVDRVKTITFTNDLLATLTYYIPPIPIRIFTSQLLSLLSEYTNFFIYGREKNVPPVLFRKKVCGKASINYFKATGIKSINILKQLAYLKPDEKILDIGCGVGRVALPLTQFLNKKGEYYGIDVNPRFVEWCKRNISTKYPNFHFQRINIFNEMYNPAGIKDIKKFQLPFTDEAFDVVVLFSVFTHMKPGEVKYYLEEIRRVLKRKGRCVASFVLFKTKDDISRLRKQYTRFRFLYDCGLYYTTNKKCHSEYILHNEEHIYSLYRMAGLVIDNIKRPALSKEEMLLLNKQLIVEQDIIISSKY